MNLKTLVPILALGIVPANATVIFIDNFAANQGPVIANSQSGVSAGTGLFGGSRSLTVIQTNGDPEQIDYGRVSSGQLTLSLSAGDQGFASLTYDGDTDAVLNQAGIAPTDLTDGGLNQYIGLSVRSDLVAPITISFYSGNGNSSTYTFDTPAQGFGLVPFSEYYIPMTSFTTLFGTGADFTGITAATLLIDGTSPTSAGVDVQVKNLAATAAPEPASLSLVAAGLAGLFISRRRKA